MDNPDTKILRILYIGRELEILHKLKIDNNRFEVIEARNGIDAVAIYKKTLIFMELFLKKFCQE